MHVAIYTKNIPGKTAVAQQMELLRLCQQRNWTCQIYSEKPGRSVRSDASDSMGARRKLIDDLLNSKYEAVAVWRISMFGNCIDDLLWTLDEIHVKRGIAVVAVADGIDTTVGDGAVTRVLKALAAVGRGEQ